MQILFRGTGMFIYLLNGLELTLNTQDFAMKENNTGLVRIN